MIVVPPNTANHIFTCNKLYNTVNSPMKLKVPGNATEAKTKIINNEVNLGACERIPPKSSIVFELNLL